MFEVICYNMNTERARVDKTAYLTETGRISGTLRAPVSLCDPVIVFEQLNVPTWNYVYISDFNRYYYVTDIVSTAAKLWSANLHIDVLNTYKNQIKQQHAVIARQENSYNSMLPDPLMPVKAGRDIETAALADPADDHFGSNHVTGERRCFVLLTAKGGSV